ncbi:unnamed protein product, partial [Ectocarpus sp. 13 AM-2016]
GPRSLCLAEAERPNYTQPPERKRTLGGGGRSGAVEDHERALRGDGRRDGAL